MPRCPNCGNRVKEEHSYCGQCGYPLAAVDDDADKIPPAGTAASRQGFLSGRSLQYLVDVRNGEQVLDPETVGYSNLSRDVGAGLADFAKVALISDVNLLALVLDNSSDADVLSEDVDQLNRWQAQERMMWMGLLQVPKLYDRAFGTEWDDEFSERLEELSGKAVEFFEEERDRS
ncbi:zinc ribbon domain-containing protein [Haloferax sp. ATB1]|uniref:zinc ribbon domain-containing protein n=1 Tax=Haloferax sp. ATB1 TaxID=1508454 RepID=UPI000FE140E6|nr:zinc ribbon domain-containing protein [Haloferax sp. ATB1]